jgi:hypothetical protein
MGAQPLKGGDMKHLWDIKHPYYMNPGNYFSNDCYFEFDSLSDFKEEWGDVDIDYNWVVRWDWIVDDNDEDEDGWVPPEQRGGDDASGTLRLQIVGQRKSRLLTCFVRVARTDEQDVRDYLEKYASYMVKMGEGFDLSPEVSPDETPPMTRIQRGRRLQCGRSREWVSMNTLHSPYDQEIDARTGEMRHREMRQIGPWVKGRAPT